MLCEKIKKALNNAALKPLVIDDIADVELSVFAKTELYQTFLGVCKLKQVASDFICKLFGVILDGNDFSTNDSTDKMILIDNLINYPDISIKDIARLSNYSERQISRLIKKNYGVTFKELKRGEDMPDDK